jgi:predicted nucleic acid-binding protein
LNAPDTSVAVAAALPWHESHAAASAELGGGEAALLAHVAVETYSVLTRLPPPQRVPPPVALAYLRETFDLPPVPLSADGYARLVEQAAEESITGGAVYDALVAATALEAGATLLTLDRRAVTTYRLLGAAYRLVA